MPTESTPEYSANHSRAHGHGPGIASPLVRVLPSIIVPPPIAIVPPPIAIGLFPAIMPFMTLRLELLRGWRPGQAGIFFQATAAAKESSDIKTIVPPAAVFR